MAPHYEMRSLIDASVSLSSPAGGSAAQAVFDARLIGNIELFAPGVIACLLRQTDSAGYRNEPGNKNIKTRVNSNYRYLDCAQ